MDINALLSSFGGDPSMKSQAEGFWKMLDDLSESDPEGYKAFIEGNMKTGVEHFQKEKEQIEKKITFPLEASQFAYELVVPLVLYPQSTPGLLLPETTSPQTGIFFVNIFTHKQLSGDISAVDKLESHIGSIAFASCIVCTAQETLETKESKHLLHVWAVSEIQRWLEAKGEFAPKKKPDQPVKRYERSNQVLQSRGREDRSAQALPRLPKLR
jgi:hypothetical protein